MHIRPHVHLAMLLGDTHCVTMGIFMLADPRVPVPRLLLWSSGDLIPLYSRSGSRQRGGPYLTHRVLALSYHLVLLHVSWDSQRPRPPPLYSRSPCLFATAKLLDVPEREVLTQQRNPHEVSRWILARLSLINSKTEQPLLVRLRSVLYPYTTLMSPAIYHR